MSEYAQHFADNDIDFSILGDLTDQDLKDIGVASLGHRRKILCAIAVLDQLEATAAVGRRNAICYEACLYMWCNPPSTGSATTLRRIPGGPSAARPEAQGARWRMERCGR